MEFYNQDIFGVKLIKFNKLNDNRGIFCKIYNEDIFEANGINIDIKESYYSISEKNVIRGMHFQIPPYDHDKLVYVANGKVLDVVLDIRKFSSTYKKFISIELSDENGLALFIPKGCAHGFKSLTNNTMMVYNVSTVYSPQCDCGIKYDSFGMDWNVENPIISKRDASFYALEDIEKFI